MCTSVIAGCDTPPVLEFAEHVLDLMTLSVEGRIVFDLSRAVFLWRDARLYTLVLQRFPEPVSIVTSIRQKMSGRRQRIDNESCSLVIAHLPF